MPTTSLSPQHVVSMGVVPTGSRSHLYGAEKRRCRACPFMGISYPCGGRGVALFLTAPHPGGNGMFFRSDGIGVDGGRGELRMPQPFLDQIEGHTRGDRRDAKAMA